MNERLRQKINKPWVGVVGGIILPLITFLIFSSTKAAHFGGLFEFIEQTRQMGTFTPVFSLCVLPNILYFLLLKQLNCWYAIKGIVFSVFLYTLFIVVLKFAY